MVSKLAKALAAVHDAGLIHGDIKPARCLLSDDQEPVLTDAGLSDLWRTAGMMDDSSYYVVGVGVELAAKARPYAAPEQNAGARLARFRCLRARSHFAPDPHGQTS